MLPKALQNPGSRTDLEGGGGARGRGSLGHPDDALSPYEGALMERPNGEALMETPLWRSPYGEAPMERPNGEALIERPYGGALMETPLWRGPTEKPYGGALRRRPYAEVLRRDSTKGAPYLTRLQEARGQRIEGSAEKTEVPHSR